ncbi:MAG: acyl--CoA ligase [Nannocystaceae bacterium]|nr:acyl--CoA ligase [Nannocystaceae bacterium]
MLLFDMIAAGAERHPGKPAAIFGDGQISFAELHQRSDKVAAWLRQQGVGPGDRVAILCGNEMPALVYFWGVLKAGAQTVDMPTLAGLATMQGILDEAAPKAIVADAAQIAKHIASKRGASDEPRLRIPALLLTTTAGKAAATEGGLTAYADDEILAASLPAPPPPNITADDVAMIVYTSGTTGRPNGVMLSHANFIENLEASNALMGLTPDDSILIVVPLYYIHGRMQLLLHAMLGGTVVFSGGFQFPAKVHAELIESRVTGFSGVPYHFKQLLQRSKLALNPPPALKYVLITGGALSPTGLRELSAALPGVGLHLAYGQTEAAPRITWIGPDEVFAKEGSVGRALPNVTLEILGPKEEPVPAGQVGEVAAGGPNIMKGYVSGDERELGKIDEQGRLRTGDLGRLDADGHLFLMGRSSEMIKSAGERIFPQEIENVIASHASVREVAVIGVPDETLGERIVAYVVLASGTEVDRATFRGHCLEQLPFVRVPKEFRSVQELPKTASGKVSRGKLRQIARQDQ